MVVMQLPDGSTAEYALNESDRALRLVSSCASFDLMTALTEWGWRIRDATTDRERQQLAALAAGRNVVGQPALEGHV
jgi:hypothetical protein